MADTEDLVLSISADTRQMKRALDRLIGDTAKSTKAIESQFDAVGDVGVNAFNRIAANSNKAAQTQAKFGQAMKQSSLQTGNLAAQLNDIGVQLAGGQSPFLIALQQGSQINQVLGAGGARAAVTALGGAFTSLVSPVSLATIAVISLAGAAVQYFTEFLGSSKESEKTLKEQADLIDKVAKKWGVATPALKAYVDELARASDQKDLEDATKFIQIEAFKDSKKAIEGFRVDLADLQTQLSDTQFQPVQAAFESLVKKIEDGSATIEDLKKLQFELRSAFIDTSVPAADKLGLAVGAITSRFEKMAEAARKAGQEARDALRRDEQSFFDPRDPRFNNGVLPKEVPAPSLLGVDDVGNNPAIRGFQENLDDAASAIEGFVDRVDRAEGTGKNPNSSASGTGQFIESTWLSLFRKYYPEQAAGMGRQAILELRKDSDIARDLIKKYATENARVLQAAGVHVDEAALQLAHFLGAGDAAKVLSAAPGTPLAGLISQKSINANPTILGGGRTVDDARAYAQRRANAPTSGSRSKTPDDLFQGSVEDVQKRIDLINAEIEAQGRLNPMVNDYGFAVDKARIAQDLLSEAKKAGLEITPELSAKIDELATNYAKASSSADRLKDSSQKAAQATREFGELGKEVLGGFISDLQAGKSAAEALSNALQKIASKLLDKGLDALFGLGGTGGGLFGGGRGLLGGAIIPGILSTGASPSPVTPPVVQKSIAAPAMLSQSVASKGASGGKGGSIVLYVKGEEGPMFRPTIQAESKGVAVQVVQAGIKKYDKRLDKTLGGKMANAQARSL